MLMLDHSKWAGASGDEGGCSASCSSMELLNEEHMAGVLKVLHAAKSGRLITSSGVLEVRPKPDSRRSDGWLFELEVLTTPHPSLDELDIEELELDFGDAVFSLEGAAVRLVSGRLHVRQPRRLFSKGLANIVVSPGLLRLRWNAGAIVIRAEVLEISMDEILIEGAGPSIVPGRPRPAVIEFLDIDRKQVTEIRCTLDVRPGPSRPTCARLLLATDADRQDLVRVYRILRFPQLIDRGAIAQEDVVDLFVKSRYLSLRETDQASPSEAWCCPDFASGLSIDTIYRADDGALLGHVSVTRAYSKTWLGHQLATLKGHPESAISRHALYRHFACAPLLSDGEDCYLLGYYDRHLRWHQLFFESFVDWVEDERQAVVLEYDRFEPEPRSELEPGWEPPATVLIEYLHPQDRAIAAALVAAHLPQLAIRAFDIDEEHIQQDALHPEYEARGVERSRQVLVLRESSEIVGVALCETGNRHLSLFNLLNMGQVYFRPEASRAGKKALFLAVRDFYRDHGSHDPVLVSPPGSFPHPQDVGLHKEETMGCIIWSGESLLQYQSFISYCFAKIGNRALVESSASTSSRQMPRRRAAASGHHSHAP